MALQGDDSTVRLSTSDSKWFGGESLWFLSHDETPVVIQYPTPDRKPVSNPPQSPDDHQIITMPDSLVLDLVRWFKDQNVNQDNDMTSNVTGDNNAVTNKGSR